MVWIDIVLLVIIVWFAFKGFRNGIIIELTTLIALVFAIWGAFKYENFTSNLLQEYLHLEGTFLPFISFAVTFLLILIAVNIIGRFITKLLNIAQLGLLNRMLGLVFAVVKVGILLALLVNGVDRVNSSQNFINEQTINQSHLYQPLNEFAKKIYKFSDKHYDEVKDKIDDKLNEIEKEDA